MSEIMKEMSGPNFKLKPGKIVRAYSKKYPRGKEMNAWDSLSLCVFIICATYLFSKLF